MKKGGWGMRKRNSLGKKVLISLLAAGVLISLGGVVFTSSAEEIVYKNAIRYNGSGTLTYTPDQADDEMRSESPDSALEVSNGSTLNIGTSTSPYASFTADNPDATAAAAVVTGDSSALTVHAGTYTQHWLTGIEASEKGSANFSVEDFVSDTTGTGIHATGGSTVNITAHKEGDVGGAVTITSGGEAIEAAGAGTGVTITDEDTKGGVTITSTDKEAGVGVAAFDGANVTIRSNTTIDAKNALTVGGGSTVAINTDKVRTTVINGDIVFTPSGADDEKSIDANVTLRLAGSASSWTGRAYQQLDEKTQSVDLDHGDSDYGNVQHMNVDIRGGAKWEMTGDSFVNEASVYGGTIHVNEGVEELNAGTIEILHNGKLDIDGGTSNIKINIKKNLVAEQESSVELDNATLSAYSISDGFESKISVGKKSTIKTDWFGVHAESSLYVQGKVTVGTYMGIESHSSINVADGGSLEATMLNASQGSKVEVQNGGTLTAADIRVYDNLTFHAYSGATVNADTFTTGANGIATFDYGSTANVDQFNIANVENVSILTDFDGKLMNGDGTAALVKEDVQKVLGLADAEESSSLVNGDYGVTMSVDEKGSLSIQSKDMSATDGMVTTKTIGTMDKDGNYDAKGNNISGVGTLSAQSITLGGADLQETIDGIHTSIKDETDARVAGDKALQTEMDNRTNIVLGLITTNAEAIVQNAKNLETLQKNLGATAEMTKDGLDQANRKIDTNTGNIEQNRLDIARNKEDIAAEVAARTEAMQTLEANIDSETAARVAGDNGLHTRISQVEKDATKGIAKASALAALRPLDYNPENKLDVAAAGGFYKGENAFAIGAYYRPNENVMFSLGTTVSGDDNAYNVGVSFKLGHSSKVSRLSEDDVFAILKDIRELKAKQAQLEAENEELKERLAALEK